MPETLTRKRLGWIAFAVSIGLCAGAAAGPDGKTWRGLEQMMSAEDFQAAGLDKLSPEQLDRLDEWLLHFIARDAQQVVRSDEKIRELQSAPARHRLVGTFRGWDGDTTFTLDNGEVWKQRVPGRYAKRLENPEIEISRNVLGFYELRIIETGRRIGVTRIR